MAIIKHEMTGSFCLSQRWQGDTETELKEEITKYLGYYPPMGYSTRFTVPYYDKEEMKWNTIMHRDRSCD